ncbi:serpin family protein [Parasphingorhabdus cellanae]|uniref:Serpin domain-containing protein n=1 Tax=Parasphingorhabdus cellanae TaxID=2806553 RepID=A0ABX7SZ62_9SPHN|nr:serpin family protein [Parasphingorhabdus cellanae]QTD54559.1 hypothetical protein J4G78_09685 [Parasphingorhabdus cellanae]
MVIRPLLVSGIFAALMSSTTLVQWIEKLKNTLSVKTIVTLPKFKLEMKSELSEPISRLGMKIPFSNEADFSEMTDEPLAIDGIIHQTFLEVDEKGTEAAAATALGIVVTASARKKEPKPVIFKADHPFFFLIRDRRTDAILFMGRYVKPEG